MASPRRPKNADFVGKTITTFKRDADNQWTFTFSDGTTRVVQAESYHVGNGMSLPRLEIAP